MNHILPAPFAWCDIPEGDVTLTGSAGLKEKTDYIPYKQAITFRVPAFSISKYLISNAQYAKFIEAGGYDEKKWWTDAGWDTKTNGIERVNGVWTPSNEAWVHPEWWTHRGFNAPDAPVVGVSWYEAIAFCNWLSDVSAETITLPTDQQYQRAAQGDDNRAYPWGDEWGDEDNWYDAGDYSGKHPLVNQFEGEVDSPFGVVHMASDAWKWCLTQYQAGENTLEGDADRIILGGQTFAVTQRKEHHPAMRDDIHAFFIVKLS